MGTSQFPPSPAFTATRAPRSKTKWLILGGLLIVVVLAVLWSCGRGTYRDYRLSSAAVDLFHHRLDSGDVDAIYGDASDGFRGAGPREDQIKFLLSVHQKLGNSGKTAAQGFHVHWQNGHIFVDQVIDTQFAQGLAREDFVWVIENDQAQLYGYHVHFPDELH